MTTTTTKKTKKPTKFRPNRWQRRLLDAITTNVPPLKKDDGRELPDPLNEACKAVGLSIKTYFRWFEDPAFRKWWREQVDARNGARTQVLLNAVMSRALSGDASTAKYAIDRADKRDPDAREAAAASSPAVVAEPASPPVRAAAAAAAAAASGAAAVLQHLDELDDTGKAIGAAVASSGSSAPSRVMPSKRWAEMSRGGLTRDELEELAAYERGELGEDVPPWMEEMTDPDFVGGDDE
ncbi:MAG: hypothetical protein AB7K09_23990 [Planctomycetota bacterium]